MENPLISLIKLYTTCASCWLKIVGCNLINTQRPPPPKKKTTTGIENAMRFYLGVHKFTPLPALYGEMGWIAVKYRHYLSTFRFRNRMMKLPNTSITRHVFQRDIDLSMTN